MALRSRQLTAYLFLISSISPVKTITERGLHLHALVSIILTVDGQEIINTDKIVINRDGSLIAYKDNKILNLNLYDKENQSICIDVKDIK